MKPSENQRLMKNTIKTSPTTTNWSNFGIHKQIPANVGRQKKAGKVFVILPNGKRILARTNEDRQILRRAVNSLRTPVVKVVEPKVTYKVRLVKARIKTLGGKTLNRVCKVKGSDGTQKIFVTKKAALAWVKNQK